MNLAMEVDDDDNDGVIVVVSEQHDEGILLCGSCFSLLMS